MGESLQVAFYLLIALLLLLVPLVQRPRSGTNPSRIIKFSKASVFINILLSIVFFVAVFQYQVVELSLVEWNKLALSMRLDRLSALMFAMVTIISFVVLRFSYVYLEGDVRHAGFIRKLMFTVASVQLLILSGNLVMFFIAWVATSLTLHQLLVIYPERKKAQMAAQKKFLVARLGDVTLAIGFYLMYQEFGTGNLESIFQQLSVYELSTLPFTLELAAIFLVLTAALKSAQLPFHGWLLDVMEAPTPVSALLHAGLLNAGPFLMLRFSHLLNVTDVASIVLVSIGMLTAIVGALVYPTQPAVKTALAYSSVGHMGFTLMLCGLGAYAASLLHLIAHSFYKAHSFLSSGSMVDKIKSNPVFSYTRSGGVLKILAILVPGLILVYAGAQFLDTQSTYHYVAIGGIISISIVALLINTLDSNTSNRAKVNLVGLSMVVVLAFVLFESMVSRYIGAQFPAFTESFALMTYATGIVLIAFTLIILLQVFSPQLRDTAFMKKFGVHLRHGFYLNLVFDRILYSYNRK